MTKESCPTGAVSGWIDAVEHVHATATAATTAIWQRQEKKGPARHAEKGPPPEHGIALGEPCRAERQRSSSEAGRGGEAPRWVLSGASRARVLATRTHALLGVA